MFSNIPTDYFPSTRHPLYILFQESRIVSSAADLQMSISTLLDWCSNNGIIIDPRIQISYDEERGVHVASKDLSIPAGDTLVRIPKDAVLSVKSCSLSDCIPFELHGLGAQLGLALALYSEILLRKHSSRWFGYLQSLPSVDLPLFWELDPLSSRDGESGPFDPAAEDLLLWLRGTEVTKRLHKKDEANRTVSDNINHYYHDIVLPILLQPDIRDRLSEEPDLVAFRKAYSLVSSRAFFLDAYHGLAMAPVADAFNHTLENHVHIESEFYVCPECGSFCECEHDYNDDHHRSRFLQWTGGAHAGGAHDLYYEMVSNAEIQPYEEVFNTYGEGLCNAQLLVQYGFILDPNDNDVLNFDTNEILCLLSSTDTSSEVPLSQHTDFTPYADSNLVFPYTHSPSKSAFCIDSDGKISSQLWIFLLRLLYRNAGHSNLFRMDDLRTFITAQTVLENITRDGRSCSTGDGNDELDPACVAMLVEVARAVVRLCEMRKTAIGHPNYVGENLGELLDSIPGDGRRFRLVLLVLMSEHSILDSCRFNWLDFVSTFGSGFR